VGRRDGEIRGDEFLIWRLQDPHAKAYQDLLGKRGLEIITNLSPRPNDLEPGSLLAFDQASEQLRRRCLECHATGGFEGVSSGVANDGVSCESCHGNAKHWLAAHTQAAWRSREDKQSLGFNDTDHLVSRARTCVKCHVGTIAGDVNHDLYAAGHPRMHFELFAYHSRLPKHWDEGPRGEQQAMYGADFPHDLLVVGALCTAEASLKLLGDRIELAMNAAGNGNAQDQNHVWPELSEYSCFHCHQDLAPAAGDQFPKRNSHPNGTVKLSTWGTWNYALLGAICDENAELAWNDCLPDELDPASIRTSLREIRDTMGQLYLTKAKLEVLHRNVRALQKQLETALDQWPQNHNASSNDTELIKDRAKRILENRADRILMQIQVAANRSWDESTMLYFAIESLRASSVPVVPSQSDFRERLAFPRQPTLLDSPQIKDPPRGLIDVLDAQK